jgi:hypothetical protein
MDGVITFIDDAYAKPKQAIVQVKSRHVKSGDIRDLKGTLDREQAALGVFVTLEPAQTGGDRALHKWKTARESAVSHLHTAPATTAVSIPISVGKEQVLP